MSPIVPNPRARNWDMHSRSPTPALAIGTCTADMGDVPGGRHVEVEKALASPA